MYVPCRLRFVDLHLITGSIMPVLPTILKTFDGLKVAGRCAVQECPTGHFCPVSHKQSDAMLCFVRLQIQGFLVRGRFV